MRRLLAIAMAVASLTASASGAVIPIQGKPSDVSVVVAYTGTGAVDASHEIWVFLFDTPNIGPGARPIVTQTITRSGAATVFKNICQDPVYLAVAYDEKGDYDGTMAAPPTGAPIGFYSTDGKGTPAPVKTPGGVRVKMSFSDARRMR